MFAFSCASCETLPGSCQSAGLRKQALRRGGRDYSRTSRNVLVVKPSGPTATPATVPALLMPIALEYVNPSEAGAIVLRSVTSPDLSKTTACEEPSAHRSTEPTAVPASLIAAALLRSH